MDIAVLDASLRGAAPIDGISLGPTGEKADWRIDFRPEATAQQRAAAQAIVDAFDPLALTRDDVFKADTSRVDMLTRLKTATPAQIDAYIEANVTNLAQARSFLKVLTKILAITVRE